MQLDTACIAADSLVEMLEPIPEAKLASSASELGLDADTEVE